MRVSAGPRGGFAVRGPGFAAVRTPGFSGAAVRRPTGFGGAPFHRFPQGHFDHRRGFNNVIVAGGGYYGYPYSYGGYAPGYYNPAPAGYSEPYATTYPPPVAESSSAALAPATGLVAGDVVGNVQRVLKYKGFYRGPIDGLSGPATRAAIRAYDVSVGLPPTGMIDARLLLSMQLM